MRVASLVAQGLPWVFALALACGGSKSGAPLATCVAPPAVAFGNEDPAYLPAELRACAFDVSCAATRDHWAYLQSIGQLPRSCLSDWSLNGLDGTACAPNAKSCDEWLACASHGHCPAWCVARGLTPQSQVAWTCDGDEVVVCQEPSGYGIPFLDCAAQGMKCERVAYAASCTDGTHCSAPANPHCEGTRLVSCDSSTGLGQSQDCAMGGGRCAPFLLSAACLGPQGTSCTAVTYPEHCDGRVANVCYSGVELGFDCASPDLGADCVVNADGSVGCASRAHECDASTPDACQGNNFVTCGTDAKLAFVDCATIGFRTCGDVGGRVGCIP